ncbi:hypothetical protein V6Z11_A05G270900 [Gossypium hirsutum]
MVLNNQDPETLAVNPLKAEKEEEASPFTLAAATNNNISVYDPHYRASPVSLRILLTKREKNSEAQDRAECPQSPIRRHLKRAEARRHPKPTEISHWRHLTQNSTQTVTESSEILDLAKIDK